MKPRFFTRLSALQIKRLCTLAGQAYKAAKARHAIEDGVSSDDYRKAGQLEAAGVESLKEATQEHYLQILGKWWTVIGNLEAAFYAFLNAGAENEAARQMRWRLMGQIARLAEGIFHRHAVQTGIEIPQADAMSQAWAYTKTLARDKFAGRVLESLNAEELEQLGFTVTNRASQKLDVGSTRGRNKSQRRAPQLPDPEQSADQEPRGSMISRVASRLAHGRQTGHAG